MYIHTADIISYLMAKRKGKWHNTMQKCVVKRNKKQAVFGTHLEKDFER